MKTFKVGDKVRMLQDCSGLKKGEIVTLKKGYGNYPNENTITAEGKCDCQHIWELVREEITWDTLKKGDVIIYDGDERTVLARIKDVICLSPFNNTFSVGGWYSIESLSMNHTIKQPIQEEKVKEMTVADVEKLVGHKVKIVK